MDYLSEPVRKEIRQKILSLYIPIPEKTGNDEEESEKKNDTQQGYNAARMAKELKKKEEERQERQLQFDKIIYKCKHAKVYQNKDEGLANS